MPAHQCPHCDNSVTGKMTAEANVKCDLRNFRIPVNVLDDGRFDAKTILAVKRFTAVHDGVLTLSFTLFGILPGDPFFFDFTTLKLTGNFHPKSTQPLTQQATLKCSKCRRSAELTFSLN